MSLWRTSEVDEKMGKGCAETIFEEDSGGECGAGAELVEGVTSRRGV